MWALQLFIIVVVLGKVYINCLVWSPILPHCFSPALGSATSWRLVFRANQAFFLPSSHYPLITVNNAGSHTTLMLYKFSFTVLHCGIVSTVPIVGFWGCRLSSKRCHLHCVLNRQRLLWLPLSVFTAFFGCFALVSLSGLYHLIISSIICVPC